MLNITLGEWVLLSPKNRKKPNQFEHNQTVLVQGRANSYFTIAEVNGPSNLDKLAEWEANARAISAVPEFIALTEHVLAMENDAYLIGHPEWGEIVKDARAAMSKAKGEAKAETKTFPECARTCGAVEVLGVGECEYVCPNKFDSEGNPRA